MDGVPPIGFGDAPVRGQANFLTSETTQARSFRILRLDQPRANGQPDQMGVGPRADL